MTARDVIAQALALSEAATEGPWYWRNSSGNVYLLGKQSRAVMTFERMGMQGAQPAFRGEDGLLYPAGKENLHAIPDALFMAESRTLLPAFAKALGDVLALHKPFEMDVISDPACCAEECDHENECPATGKAQICAACHDLAESINAYYAEQDLRFTAYPCPTVTAITAALSEVTP